VCAFVFVSMLAFTLARQTASFIGKLIRTSQSLYNHVQVHQTFL